MMERALDIPLLWQTIDFLQLQGTLMVLGKPDVGKSTFSRYLYQRLCAVFPRVGYLDGDPGQSTLGPPGTVTLALALEGEDAFPPRGRIWRSFVGSISPRGHMLQVLTGAARLTAAARMAGVQALAYDTTGFVQQVSGGAHLKLAKIDLLRPAFLLALQQEREKVNWAQFAVFPAPDFEANLLVALEDALGFTIGLGIVEEVNRGLQEVLLQTPLSSLKGVDATRLGDIAIDLPNFLDRQLRFRRGDQAA